MIQLHFGSDLSQFMDSIHRQFVDQAKNSWTNSMSTPTLIAGTPLIQRWLNLRLSEENGILMGLKIQRLENTIWDILETNGAEILNVDTLEPILLKIIQEKLDQFHNADSKEKDPQWGDLYAYLYQEGKLETEKWVQLSKSWARSFLEYELNRPAGGNDPGLLAQWAQSEKYFRHNEDTDKVEKTQMDLWKCLSEELQQNHAHLKSLPMVWAENEKQGFPLLKNRENPPTWIVIGLPGISHFHRNALMKLGEKINLQVYLLNPCAEFWEDVETGKKRRKLSNIPQMNSEDYSKESLEDYSDQVEDQKLLELWGSADRENLLLWGQVANDLEFDKKIVKENDTLLHTVQNLVLSRENNADPKIPLKYLKDDSSLFLVKAPTQIREMETLRDLALGMMDSSHPLYSEGLKASDFCLLLPDVGAYQVALEQSFLQSSSKHRLPVFIQKGLGKSSLVSSLLLQFVELLQSGFQRGKVFKFLQNELVLSKLKMDRSLLADWEKWASELNLYRGFNKEHRGDLGDFEPIDIHTWQYAFDRIVAGWLGLIPLEIGAKEHHPWKASVLDDRENMAKMIAEVTHLFESLTVIQNYLKSCEKFDKEIVIDECNKWIDLKKLDHKEEQIWEAWLNSLEGLETQGKVDLELFCTWSKHHLGEELDADLLKHTGAMVIAPLRMGHVLPHKVIFVGGLGADFPGQMQKSSMDLLKHHRILGDADPVKNAQGAFLHTLLSAEQKLILSYTAQNIQKDEILYPSSVITELDTYLKNSVLEIPENANRDSTDSDQDAKVGLPELEARLLARDPQNLGADSLTYSYDKALLEALNYTLDDNSQKFESEPKTWRTGDLTLKDLADFIKSPLDYRLRKGLGLYDEEVEDSTQIEDEPLAWDGSSKAIYFKEFADKFYSIYGIQSERAVMNDEDFRLQFVQDLKVRGVLAESYFEGSQAMELSKFAVQCVKNLNFLGANCPNHQWIGRTHPFWSEHFPETQKMDFNEEHEVQVWAEIPEFALYNKEEQSVLILQVTGSKSSPEKLIHTWLQGMWLRLHFAGEIRYMQLGVEEKYDQYEIQEDSVWIQQNLISLLMQEKSLLLSPSSQQMPFKQCFTLAEKGNLSKDNLKDALEGDFSDYYPSQGVQLVEVLIPDDVAKIFAERTRGFGEKLELKESKND